MQTNHLSHFLLTKELYPVLVKAVELRGEARVVNHSSFARNGPPGTKLTAENCKLYLGKNGGDLGGVDAAPHLRREEVLHHHPDAAALHLLDVPDDALLTQPHLLEPRYVQQDIGWKKLSEQGKRH